jgi:hypothetical protein
MQGNLAPMDACSRIVNLILIHVHLISSQDYFNSDCFVHLNCSHQEGLKHLKVDHFILFFMQNNVFQLKPHEEASERMSADVNQQSQPHSLQQNEFMLLDEQK